MKFKILHDIKIAHEQVSKPHYSFKKDEVITILDKHLKTSLLNGNHAEEVKPEVEEVNAKKMKKPSKNKMMPKSLNKSIEK